MFALGSWQLAIVVGVFPVNKRVCSLVVVAWHCRSHMLRVRDVKSPTLLDVNSVNRIRALPYETACRVME